MTSGTRIFEILDRLPNFRAKGSDSNTYKFLNGFAVELDDLDAQTFNLTSEIQIDTSSGNYLNDIGDLYELVRYMGETDTQFRDRIKAQFDLYSGSGTLDAIKKVVAFTANTSTTLITITEYAPLKASVGVVLATSDVNIIDELYRILDRAKSTGVKLFLKFSWPAPPPINDGWIANLSEANGPDLV